MMCCAFTGGAVRAQETAGKVAQDQIFWSQQVDRSQTWGRWLLEVYKPYSDELSRAILKIASSAAGINPEGKSSEALLAEVNAALNNSLIAMEMIKPPAELKIYHSKVIQLYKETINADPKEKEKTAVIVNQLSREADREMKKALELHGVPERVIYNFIRD